MKWINKDNKNLKVGIMFIGWMYLITVVVNVYYVFFTAYNSNLKMTQVAINIYGEANLEVVVMIFGIIPISYLLINQFIHIRNTYHNDKVVVTQ